MRPRYERAGDVGHQERLMRMVADTFHPLPIQYRLDYFVPQPPQVWEVKRRGKKYPTWMVSLSKLIAARSFEACGLEAWALIEIAGDVYKMRFTHTPVATVAWGGRQDRGDPQDMEPVVHYRLEDMELVKVSHRWPEEGVSECCERPVAEHRPEDDHALCSGCGEWAKVVYEDDLE